MQFNNVFKKLFCLFFFKKFMIINQLTCYKFIFKIKILLIIKKFFLFKKY